MYRKVKIGIIGAGSRGGTFATFLCAKGYDVEITKPKGGSLILDNMINFEVQGALGNKSYLVPFVKNDTFTSNKDIIIICTKAYDLEHAIKVAKKFLKPNGVLLTLQNVMHLSEIANLVDIKRYVPIVIDWSSKRQSSTEIVVTSSGSIHIGALTQETLKYLPMLKKIFESIAPTVIEHNMYNFMLSRFILHCNQSCLGALTGYNLGIYLSEKAGKKIFIQLIKEQLFLFEQLNVTIPPYNNILDYYKFVENSVSGILYRSKMFRMLIHQNGNCVSVTLRQLENGKRSELDYLCNYFNKLAEEHNINLPYNKAVAEMLYEIERGERSIILQNLCDKKLTNL